MGFDSKFVYFLGSPPCLSRCVPAGWQCVLVAKPDIYLPVRINQEGYVECLSFNGGKNVGDCQWATGKHPYTCRAPGPVVLSPQDEAMVLPRVGNGSWEVDAGTWEYSVYRTLPHSKCDTSCRTSLAITSHS